MLFLSDILPTGYQAALNAEITKGSTFAIFGAGPIGLISAECARMLGADQIFMINNASYRLEFAKATYGINPLNFDDIDPSEQILSMTHNRGVDASIDAVSFEAKVSTGDQILTTKEAETSSGASLRQCIAATRRGGIVGVPGVYAGLCMRF
ncbi:threonine dehydrogenase-like Zn-dependent dehydrogenase [Rhodanobacter sp. A1T4]|nr:threonine dehydrogenase-like Zn-dependent dehydrogenase [Rhodanobacter sp. A1T4]